MTLSGLFLRNKITCKSVQSWLAVLQIWPLSSALCDQTCWLAKALWYLFLFYFPYLAEYISTIHHLHSPCWWITHDWFHEISDQTLCDCRPIQKLNKNCCLSCHTPCTCTSMTHANTGPYGLHCIRHFASFTKFGVPWKCPNVKSGVPWKYPSIIINGHLAGQWTQTFEST